MMLSSSSRSRRDLSNIPLDTLLEVIKRLEVPDVIRAGSVCKSWRNLALRKYANKTQIPWLLFSSGDKIDYFYSMPEKKKYAIRLPDIDDDDRRYIGSSQGFLINLDRIADLHAVNPITGTHISLPPTSNSTDITDVVTDPETGQITHYIEIVHSRYYRTPVSARRDQHYKKAILSPSTEIAVAISFVGDMAYAIVGDNKWTVLRAHDYIYFCDATFHKGRLHAVTKEGTVAIFDSLSSAGEFTFVSLKGPPITNICLRKYLVESPDGKDLFLVYKEIKTVRRRPRMDVRVFLLDKATHTWKQMTSLGDVALFLGINHSMSLCTREHPGLKRNSLYFTGKEFTLINPMNEPGLVFPGDMVVFNLKDGSIDQIIVDSNLDRVDLPGPIWFMPILS